MHWEKLLSAKRFGMGEKRAESAAVARSQFQRDFDRVVFSSPFRRLQNKTQVFPLPGSVFVHNRLTHSMEVASVGRSIANIISLELLQRNELKGLDILNELSSIVSAACLCHDMGNPPFGHAGEDAISRFFNEGEGRQYKSLVSETEWKDLTHFEGNANALRLLTHQFNGRRKGGFALTYSTLASLIKYPYSSGQNKKKYGFFQSERETFLDIMNELGLKKISPDSLIYARHPLVYIVEAADDICYEIMDIEDAHKLRILDTDTTFRLLMNFFDEKEDEYFFKRKTEVFKEVTDLNERVAYLRASVINKLVNETSGIFLKNHDAILSGDFKTTLVKELTGTTKKAFGECKDLAVKQIYNDQSVVKIELTGFNVLATLLKVFINAVLEPDNDYSRKLLSILPEQFKGANNETGYSKIRNIIDFVSGMTDLYAVDLYKDIKGIRF